MADRTDNLIPFDKMSKEEARKIQSMGGKASAEARRRKRTFKEEFLAILSDDKVQLDVVGAIIKKAMEGDVNAYKAIEAAIGEKPTDKLEVDGVSTILLKDDVNE